MAITIHSNTKGDGKMKAVKLGLILLLFCFIAGASCQQQIKTPDQMTPKERGVFVLTLYNNAYANYNTQFAATPQPMSASAKEYFQGYKKVMETSWPVISAYSSIVQIGATPTPAQEQEIIKLIYQLQAILMGVKS